MFECDRVWLISMILEGDCFVKRYLEKKCSQTNCIGERAEALYTEMIKYVTWECLAHSKHLPVIYEGRYSAELSWL